MILQSQSVLAQVLGEMKNNTSCCCCGIHRAHVDGKCRTAWRKVEYFVRSRVAASHQQQKFLDECKCVCVMQRSGERVVAFRTSACRGLNSLFTVHTRFGTCTHCTYFHLGQAERHPPQLHEVTRTIEHHSTWYYSFEGSGQLQILDFRKFIMVT